MERWSRSFEPSRFRGGVHPGGDLGVGQLLYRHGSVLRLVGHHAVTGLSEAELRWLALG